jgi:hypothetical protein
MKLFCPILIAIVLCTSCGNTNHNPMANIITKQKAIGDLSSFTKILRTVHPSLYLYVTEQRFNKICDSIKASIEDDLPLSSFYQKLNYVANETGCSHTVLQLPDAAYDTLLNRKYFFPYSVKLIEDKLYINSYEYDLPECTEITDINGIPVKTILQNIMVFEGVEGKHRYAQKAIATASFSFNYFLKYGAVQKFNLNIIDTNGVATTAVENAITLQEWNDRDYNYQYFYDKKVMDYDLYLNNEKNYSYMRLKTFSYTDGEEQDAFENFCSNSFQLLRSKNIKNLIIDVRDNRGGSLYNLFLFYSYLSSKPFKEYKNVTSKVERIPFEHLLSQNFRENDLYDVNNKLSTEFVKTTSRNYYLLADSLVDTWQPDPQRFLGDIFLITNSSVTSSGSYFSLLVKNGGVGRIIGEETAGGACSGNGFTNVEYVLPNSQIKLILPYAHIIYTHKDAINKGQGVQPNYTVPDNKKAFLENIDNQYSFITDSIINKNKP